MDGTQCILVIQQSLCEWVELLGMGCRASSDLLKSLWRQGIVFGLTFLIDCGHIVN